MTEQKAPGATSFLCFNWSKTVSCLHQAFKLLKSYDGSWAVRGLYEHANFDSGCGVIDVGKINVAVAAELRTPISLDIRITMVPWLPSLSWLAWLAWLVGLAGLAG